MAVLANMARMTTSTTGTGTITLGSAVSGFISFASAGITNGQTVSYAIEDGANREVGRGVYTSSGTTLTRSVLKSTNANAAISLSGSAQVFITALSEDILQPGTAGQIRAGSSGVNITPDGAVSACAAVALTDATTVAIDWNAGINFTLAMTANRTIGNPTNVQAQTWRTLTISSNSGTSRTPAYGSNFKGVPSDAVTNASVLVLTLFAYSATQIIVTSKLVSI